jgi:aspartate aminotransferase
MITETKLPEKKLMVSDMAENLIGSEIIKLAGEINERIKKGEHVFNYTIGDFNPSIFPIPDELKDLIIKAYKKNHTNYPPSNGVGKLRRNIAEFHRKRQELDYAENEVLVSGGARPLIYAVYQTILDPGDAVLFPVPSWNNNHYCHLSKAHPVFIETSPGNNFMPKASQLEPFIKDASLITLCSPLNPTGTVLSRNDLTDICDLVIEENKRRGPDEKPLYILYDQIYWMLTFGETVHYDPVRINAGLKNYTIFIDGISKAFAATGVRVGWAMGPLKIINKMKAILSHIGAWAPKAEQIATAEFLENDEAVDRYLRSFSFEIGQRLEDFYAGFLELKAEGFNVDAIAPQAAIYLTVKINLNGMQTPEGRILENPQHTSAYLLDEAKLGLVPFSAFGSSDQSTWYRLSVGTCAREEIKDVFSLLRKALGRLKPVSI